MLLRTNKRSDRMEIIDCIEIVKKTQVLRFIV